MPNALVAAMAELYPVKVPHSLRISVQMDWNPCSFYGWMLVVIVMLSNGCCCM